MDQTLKGDKGRFSVSFRYNYQGGRFQTMNRKKRGYPLAERMLSIMLILDLVLAGVSFYPAAVRAEEMQAEEAQSEDEVQIEIDLEETEAETAGMEEIIEQAAEECDSFAPEAGQELLTTGGKPEFFDLRNADGNGTSYITPVKQQNPFGSCWGFGAIAAAESSILSQGLAAESGYDSDTLDLSEKQTAWFVTQPVNDKNNPQYGEGLQFFNGNPTDAARYNLGGFTLYATNLFASGAGPVDENTATDDGDIFRYKGRNGNVLLRSATWIDENGEEQTGVKKLFYNSDDDWSIPDQYRFRQSYSLKESYMLPTPSTKENGGTVKIYHPEATEAIKEQLLLNRAVCISLKADHSRPGESSRTGGNMSDNWSQCILDDNEEPNHVVTIVGYDDNYPKELFREGSQPQEDGAWLIKNSWGSDLNEFPNNGYEHWGLLEGQDQVGQAGGAEAVSAQHTGYCWLSYEDKSIENPEAYSFESAVPDQVIQQHDYLPVQSYQMYATEAVSRMANVFKAGENGKIEDVSVFTATPGTTVSFKIYLLWDDCRNPEEGECVYESAPATYSWGGYHKVSIDPQANIIVSNGQKYAVVVEEITPSGKYSISFGQGVNLGKCAFTPVVNAEESYLFIDNVWKDISEKETQDILVGEDAYGMDNFPIKTYLTPTETGGAYLSINGLDPFGEQSQVLKVNQQTKVEAFFKGAADDLPVTPEISWQASDPEIFSIDIKDKNNCVAILTAKKAGTANLIVDAGIYGKKIIKIDVHKYAITGATLAPESEILAYTGEPLQPEPVEVTAETAGEEITTDLTKDQDYTVSYKNNVQCGIADVIVKGTGEYEGGFDEGFLTFMIVPAKAKIDAVTPGAGSLTVRFASQKESGISGYILACTDTATGKVVSNEVKADSTEAVVNNLEEGKTYRVTLKAFVDLEGLEPVWDPEKQDYVDPQTRYYGEESDAVTSGRIPGKDSGGGQNVTPDSSADQKVKAANPMKASGKTVRVSYSKLQEKARKIKRSKAIKVQKAQGKVTYKLKSAKKSGKSYKKYFKVSKKGKITVKKKLKKGTYKLKIKVKAAGNSAYLAKTKTVTVKIKVK